MALKIATYDVEIEFSEPLLATTPKDREVFSTFLATKAREAAEKLRKKNQTMGGGEEPTKEEVDAKLAEEAATVLDDPTADEREKRGWSGFMSDDEGYFLYNFALKGFLSEAARALKEWGQVKQLADKVKRYAFIAPRRIRLPKPQTEDGQPEVLERPLRAATPMGPRVTVVRSDTMPAGTVIQFQVKVLHGAGLTKAVLADLFAYGELMGLGQWRSGGWGVFTTKNLALSAGAEEAEKEAKAPKVARRGKKAETGDDGED